MKNKDDLSGTWNKVWQEGGRKSYSSLRLYKTVKKIDALIKSGVDFQNKRVLDIGCGGGTALFYLQEKYNITGVGIDISNEVISKNSAKVNNKLQFFVGDHKSLKFSDNEFDIILSWGVVEHFKEYIQALSEARRVLKRDGVLVLIQPNLWSFGVIQEKILRLRNKWRFGDQKNFSYKYLVKILEGLGYYDLTVYTKPPYKDMAVTRIFDIVFKRFIKHWGHYLYILAKKRNLDATYQESFELFLSHTNEKEVIRNILEEKIDFTKVNSCLDIGGGNGFLSDSLGDKKKMLIVEPNKNFVDILRKNGFRCVCAKWENVEFEEKFDLINAAYVTTYFPQANLQILVEKMIRHLSNDGKLVILAVDEKKGSWREAHTYFYGLMGLKKTSSTTMLKKVMKKLGFKAESFVTTVYADSCEQMLDILAFDFYRYGTKFDENKNNLKQYLSQFEKNGKIELDMVHWMFTIKPRN